MAAPHQIRQLEPSAAPGRQLARKLKDAQTAEEAAAAITDKSLPWFQVLLRHFVAHTKEHSDVKACRALLGLNAADVRAGLDPTAQGVLARLCDGFILEWMQKRRVSGPDLPHVEPLPSPVAESGPWVSVFAIVVIASVGSWAVFTSVISFAPKTALGASLIAFSLYAIVKVFRKNAKQANGSQ